MWAGRELTIYMLITKYDYAPMSRQTVNGSRHYMTPGNKPLPSVTTILDKTKPEESRRALQEWRDRIGHEKAQQITTEAASRGTRMHSYLEYYIKNGEMKELPSNPFAQPSWFMAGQVILEAFAHVNEFWGVEVPVYYPDLYAGTTDCVGVWKGKPAIIDFKQSNKVKKREWIDDYFLQLGAYSLAHDQMHGTNIDQGVILMCVKPEKETATPKFLSFEVSGDEFDSYKDQWIQRVNQYYSELP